ncbi:unnamed protein product [Ceratitis capitata]|uniref:(Mediterranean fruit fly) hypothetical protein n=1 Tax=Ceratitis capitata TaxID=7213 RepID=A0A811VJF4_CERCA|nr:unnamed protein product [Ceratitis capitata]
MLLTAASNSKLLHQPQTRVSLHHQSCTTDETIKPINLSGRQPTSNAIIICGFGLKLFLLATRHHSRILNLNYLISVTVNHLRNLSVCVCVYWWCPLSGIWRPQAPDGIVEEEEEDIHKRSPSPACACGCFT